MIKNNESELFEVEVESVSGDKLGQFTEGAKDGEFADGARVGDTTGL